MIDDPTLEIGESAKGRSIVVDLPEQTILDENNQVESLDEIDGSVRDDIIRAFKEERKEDVLRQIAEDQPREKPVARASRLIWSRDGLLTVCDSCYRGERDEPVGMFPSDRDEIEGRKREEIEEGTRCDLCEERRIRKKMDEIDEKTEIHVRLVDHD